MKGTKFSVVVGLLIIFHSPAAAQFLIGPKVGIQVSRVAYKDKEYRKDYSTRFKPGYNFGLVLNYKVNQTYSLHTELFYSRKGKVEKDKESEIKNVAAYNYIDLPLMLRISTHKKIKKQNVEYYGNIGSSFGYWLGGKGKISTPELREYIDSEEMKYKIKFGETDNHRETLAVIDPNRLQIELSVGGGAILDMPGGQKLMIDLRYGYGIGQTFLGKKNSGDFGLSGYVDNFEAVNQIISISAAYLFEFNLHQAMTKGKSINKKNR